MITTEAAFRLTGIAVETLRNWGGRYGLPVPERGPYQAIHHG